MFFPPFSKLSFAKMKKPTKMGATINNALGFFCITLTLSLTKNAKGKNRVVGVDKIWENLVGMRRKGTQCGWLGGLPFLPPHPTGNSLFRQDRGILRDRSRFLYPLTRPFLWCENKRAKQGFIMLIKLTDSTQWRLAPPKIKITKTKQNQNQGKMFHVCNVMQFVFFQVFSFYPAAHACASAYVRAIVPTTRQFYRNWKVQVCFRFRLNSLMLSFCLIVRTIVNELTTVKKEFIDNNYI